VQIDLCGDHGSVAQSSANPIEGVAEDQAVGATLGRVPVRLAGDVATLQLLESHHCEGMAQHVRMHPDPDSVAVAAQVRGAKQLPPGRFRHRGTHLGEPEHGWLKSVWAVDQQSHSVTGFQVRHFHPGAAGGARDGPVRIFDDERMRPAPVATSRPCLLDNIGPTISA